MKTNQIYLGVLAFCCCLILVLAQNGDEEGLIYETSEQVEQLSTEDLTLAIYTGQLHDFSLIGDVQLRDLIAHADPESEMDGARLFYESHGDYYSPLFEEVDRRMTFSQFAEENPDVADAWLRGYGIDRHTIDFQYTKIEYDGESITTYGSSPASFSPRELAAYLQENRLGAALYPSGRLLIEDDDEGQIEIFAESRTTDEWPDPAQVTIREGRLIVEEGMIEVAEMPFPAGLQIVAKPGVKLQVGETKYESSRGFTVTVIEEELFTVSGKNVIVSNSNDGRSSFSGTIEQKENDYGLETYVQEGSTCTKYIKEETNHGHRQVRFFEFKATQRTKVSDDECREGTNCVDYDIDDATALKVIVTVSGGNNLKLIPGRVRFVEVMPITDGSSVNIKKSGGGVKIAKDSVDPLGSTDLRQLPEIKSWKDEN